VPLHFVGEAPAVTQLNGTLMRNLEAVAVECLPADLPARIDVDVTSLHEFHHAIHVSDLALPRGVTLLTAPETSVATVVPSRVETELAAEAAEAAAEAPAEAEAAAPEAAAGADTEAPASEQPESSG
jgi:large subunit ribosomal protein L25